MGNDQDKVSVRMLPSVKAALANINSIPTHTTIDVDGRKMEVVHVQGIKVLRTISSGYQYNDLTDRPRDGRTFPSVHVNNHKAFAVVQG